MLSLALEKYIYLEILFNKMVNKNSGCVIPFDVVYSLFFFRVGIIGDPKNLYSTDKLMPVGGENEDEENEEDNAKRCLYCLINKINTVKPAHAVTSIKQSPVLKGHSF